MTTRPDIMAFLKSLRVEVLPHEVEPYLEFDGPKSSKEIIIVKSRAMRGTEFCKNVALFDIAGSNFEHETVIHAFPRQETSNRYVKDRLLPELVKPYTYLNSKFKNQKSIGSLVFADNGLYYSVGAAYAESFHGISGDFLIRDEIGEFSTDALENTECVLDASQYKLSLDVGTPIGSKILKKLWQQSDKRKYFYCCIDCGEYFQPTLELLCGIKDVRCPNCDKEQDKMAAAVDGKWMAMRNARGKYCKVGFHFTQLINPLIETVQMLRWREELSPERFKAEILGEI